MKIIKSFATNNGAYKNGLNGARNKGYGGILHSVGTAQPNAEVFVRNHSTPTSTVMPHAFMGADGLVYQTLPWDYLGWHVGGGAKGSGNVYFEGLETTEPATIRYTDVNHTQFVVLDYEATQAFVDSMYNETVQFFAYRCKERGWDPLDKTPLGTPVIMSHAEAYKYGYGTNHADPMHLWGKFGKTMDGLRQDVATALGGAVEESTYTVQVSGLTGDKADTLVNNLKLEGYKRISKIKEELGEPPNSYPYIVKVIKGPLNVRSGPGTQYSKTITVPVGGIYTITGESNGWGKLKSGAGWISLEYTQRV